MKTNSLVLGGLLLVSIATNVYLWSNKGPTPPVTCYSTPGFDRPVTISKDEATGYLHQYSMSLPESDKTLGAIITRSSLDEILCTKDCNAIAYGFGRDSMETSGPAGNGVFVILTGVKVDYNSDTHTIERVTELGIKRYMPRNWCPPTCGLN